MRPCGSNTGVHAQRFCPGFRLYPSVLVHVRLRMSPQVPSNTALKFADAHNMLLFETSAKDPKESQNVDSIFMSLACRLKAQKSLLYRDVEREEGRVRLSQETETKSSCPCWGDWAEPVTIYKKWVNKRVVEMVWRSVFKANVKDKKKMVELFQEEETLLQKGSWAYKWRKRSSDVT